MALGRHGNFFHWGFAASPTHLTEDAKLVLVNAIHYISRFDRRGVVARKRAGTTLRINLNDEIRALESGKLSGDLRSIGRYFSSETWAITDKAPAELARVLKSIGPYVYPTGWYQLSVDEDLRALGIPNASKGFLEKAMELLKNSEQTTLAMRLLRRYTTETFNSKDEWVTWLKRHHGHCFFSESAGYKWLAPRGATRAFKK